jgi:cobalamin synthase
MPVFSKWIIVAAIFHSKSARQDGLGKIFIENTRLMELVIATFLTLSFLILVPYIGNGLITRTFCCSGLSPIYLLAMLVLYVFSLVAVWFSNKRFGGMTGDNFGAVSEISKILFLMMVVTWSQGFI